MNTFRKSITKAVIVVALAVSMLLGTVAASDYDTWELQYYSYLPSSENRSTDYLYVAYYSSGYRANVNTFTLGNGSVCRIKGENAGGISGGYKQFTTTGSLGTFSMNNSISTDVKFRVYVYNNYSTGNWQTTGLIHINN